VDTKLQLYIYLFIKGGDGVGPSPSKQFNITGTLPECYRLILVMLPAKKEVMFSED